MPFRGLFTNQANNVHYPANTANARHESRGEATGSSTGTTLTANASANTKGSWTALGSATTFAYEGITIYLGQNNAAADYMIDIGIDDGAGNNFVLVPDLHFAAFKQANEHNLALNIPVHVPAGALIEARVAASTGSSTCNCHVVGHSANPGGFPGYSRAVALFTPASSRGVAVDPGGTANTKGSWAQLQASTAVDVAAVFGVIGFNNDAGRAAGANSNLDIGLGAGGSEFVVLPDIVTQTWAATWDGPNDVFFQPVSCPIPSGTRIAARLACSTNTAGDRTIDLALYGLVP